MALDQTEDRPSRSEIVATYIEEARRHEAGWAWVLVDDLVHHQEYDEVFAIAVEIARVTDDSGVIGLTAAGPLEDVLHRAGPSLVDRAEAEARANPRFAFALSIVRGVDQPIQQRLWAVAEEVRTHATRRNE
jgi:hypothetical protein